MIALYNLSNCFPFITPLTTVCNDIRVEHAACQGKLCYIITAMKITIHMSENGSTGDSDTTLVITVQL